MYTCSISGKKSLPLMESGEDSVETLGLVNLLLCLLDQGRGDF